MTRWKTGPRLFSMGLMYSVFVVGLGVGAGKVPLAAELPPQAKRWLVAQDWQRDTDGPIVSLGAAGEFDDRHIFAPCVVRHDGRFLMWYCGSRHSVAERVFRLGLATSDDGRVFSKHAANPVFEWPGGSRSVLTPAVLRNADGSLCREDGTWRLYFSSTDFPKNDPLHTLHVVTSRDGMNWSTPSDALLENVYAPTILKEPDVYRMWYVDVAARPWVIRYATSQDGRRWQPSSEPVLTIDQSWERDRLFYPFVVKADGVYLMWYGSYWNSHANKTALGFAVSLDPECWHKNPHNPIFRPDASRPWESHYTTSQSVLRQPDGSWRMWYASRKAPPHVNKYFAISTARWAGPDDHREGDNAEGE